MNDRIFYPMLTATMKSLLSLSDPLDMYNYIDLMVQYPNYQMSKAVQNDKLAKLILQELDRQYARWQRGRGK